MMSEGTHRRERPEIRKSLQPPDPQNHSLADFLEKAFAGDQCPEKIEVRQMFGAGCKQKGPMVEEYPYKPGTKAPSKEMLGKLANEVLRRCHEDCDGVKRPMRYGVLVYDYHRRDDYFRRLIIPLSPRGVDGADGDSLDGGEDGFGGDDGDLSGMSPRERFLLRFLGQAYSHNEKMSEQFHDSIGAIIDRQERRIEQQDRTHDALIEKNFRLLEIVERSLSLEHERKQLEKWTDLKVHAATDALTMVRGLVPVIANHFAGREVMEGPSAVALAVKSFIESLDPEQALAAFGYDSEKNKYTQDGVFSREQSALFSRLATGEAPDEAIDALVASIKPEQMIAARQIFREAQLLPLLALVQNRFEKKGAATSTVPQ